MGSFRSKWGLTKSKKRGHWELEALCRADHRSTAHRGAALGAGHGGLGPSLPRGSTNRLRQSSQGKKDQQTTSCRRRSRLGSVHGKPGQPKLTLCKKTEAISHTGEVQRSSCETEKPNPPIRYGKGVPYPHTYGRVLSSEAAFSQICAQRER